MMSSNTKITLKAARVNAGLSQTEAAKSLSSYFGMPISRQRVASFESNPDKVPPAWAEGFSKIYNISLGDISFAHN